MTSITPGGTCEDSTSPKECTSDGEIGCITTSTFKAVDTSDLATKIVSGNTVAGVAGTTTLPAISDVSFGVQYGAGGTEFTGTSSNPASCSSAGEQDCVATGSYFAGQSCSSNGANDCFAASASSYFAATACGSNGADDCFVASSGSYDAADLSNLSAGNIKSGVTIAGTAGDYPSSTYPLPSASAIADLDNATFNAKIKSVTAFEYWTSAGAHQTGAGDAHITAANIVSGTSIFGIAGSASAGGPTCTSDGETGCTTDATFKAVDTSAINEWDIKTGKKVGGISGSVKTNCRNAANLSVFDRATANATVDWWDTIDNYNNADLLPTAQPSGWTAANLCGKELWNDDTTDGACDSAEDDCLMKDNVTGLTWSEGGAVQNTASADTAVSWDNAIAHCQGLNTENSGAGYGGIKSWRLPTQMELQTASQHGIRQLGYKGGAAGGDTLDNNIFFIVDVDQLFWSATTQSDNTAYAWRVMLNTGYTSTNTKTFSDRILCVSP